MVQRFGVALDGVFGGGVKTHVRRRKEAEHAADEDDTARALGAHRGQHRTRHSHGAEEVHVEEIPRLGRVGLLDGAHDAAARVVDEDVNPPGLGEDLLDAALDRLVVAHVEHHLLHPGQLAAAPGADGPEDPEPALQQARPRWRVRFPMRFP